MVDDPSEKNRVPKKEVNLPATYYVSDWLSESRKIGMMRDAVRPHNIVHQQVPNSLVILIQFIKLNETLGQLIRILIGR